MITEDATWEVLVRLPTKSLMKFKCVSKLWYSIIRNPKFAKSHAFQGRAGGGGGCFRGLLYTDFCYYQGAQRFFYVNVNDFSGLKNPHMTIQVPDYAKLTSIVQGLIGMYNDNINAFTLFNIATHECLNLPPSPSPSGYVDSDTVLYDYFLGFDPVKEVYKVLSTSIHFDKEDNNKCKINGHVFTLDGDNLDMKWRFIAPPSRALYNEVNHCLCINGALYWLHEFYPRSLSVFHLDMETYEAISIPECINGWSNLVEIRGTPALIVTTDDSEMLDVWTMKNYCRRGTLVEWTRTSVLRNRFYISAGLMLLGEHNSNKFPLPIYMYAYLRNEVNSIPIEGYGGSQESGMYLYFLKVCSYEENIISLDCLMSNH